jgi:hypothetical protein
MCFDVPFCVLIPLLLHPCYRSNSPGKQDRENSIVKAESCSATVKKNINCYERSRERSRKTERVPSDTESDSNSLRMAGELTWNRLCKEGNFGYSKLVSIHCHLHSLAIILRSAKSLTYTAYILVVIISAKCRVIDRHIQLHY